MNQPNNLLWAVVGVLAIAHLLIQSTESKNDLTRCRVEFESFRQGVLYGR
ncbi:hypothetical protein [Calothrix sp. 336/3]|nr:hypothetical protein [Calothrix sp. 336/3]